MKACIISFCFHNLNKHLTTNPLNKPTNKKETQKKNNNFSVANFHSLVRNDETRQQQNTTN